MIGISKLYCGTVNTADVLRYGAHSAKLPSHLLQFSEDKKPVVVWNVTRRCNLQCVHCYSNSFDIEYTGELDTAEGKALIDDLAAFGAPVLLLSGGEPLIRTDFIDLARYAVSKGMRVAVSTNGTLITRNMAKEFREIGLSYVGISLDGIGDTHSRFRNSKGAFEAALRGLRVCRDLGIKVGVRFAITKRNFREIQAIFDFIEKEDIPRVCFYHLVYAGRGWTLRDEDLTREEARNIMDLLIDCTRELFEKGSEKEVLTVDNHCDGPYIYLRMLRENESRAADVLKLLKMNKGNNSGVGIGCVSWDGEVHPDQFWRNHSFGNIRKRQFSEIWMDTSNDLIAGLKDRRLRLKGRCEKCKWLDICGGNSRARAEAFYDDPWAPDPACYLTDEEIGIK
jgi:12,18-didecarboxysiroheme deacetylase